MFQNLTFRRFMTRSKFIKQSLVSNFESQQLQVAFQAEWNRKAISLESPNERSDIEGQPDLFHVSPEPERLLCNFWRMPRLTVGRFTRRLCWCWQDRKQTTAQASSSGCETAPSTPSTSGKQVALGRPPMTEPGVIKPARPRPGMVGVLQVWGPWRFYYDKNKNVPEWKV